MFVIDFDDTIFNTRPGFMEARFAALQMLGVTREVYDQTYLETWARRPGEKMYSDRRHAEALAKFGFSIEKVLAAFAVTITPEKLKGFLFPDTISFLEKIKAWGEPMVLLSLGDEEIQYRKVRGADLEKYFDRVFFVNDAKEHVLSELLAGVTDKNIWFINDNVAQTQELIKEFPRLKAVLKQALPSQYRVHPNESYAQSGLPYFVTLTEIYDYLAKNR